MNNSNDSSRAVMLLGIAAILFVGLCVFRFAVPVFEQAMRRSIERNSVEVSP